MKILHTDGQWTKVIRKAHLSFQLRWAKKGNACNVLHLSVGQLVARAVDPVIFWPLCLKVVKLDTVDAPREYMVPIDFKVTWSKVKVTLLVCVPLDFESCKMPQERRCHLLILKVIVIHCFKLQSIRWFRLKWFNSHYPNITKKHWLLASVQQFITYLSYFYSQLSYYFSTLFHKVSNSCW